MKGGHTQCLKLVLDAGCPVDKDKGYSAVYNGHVECSRVYSVNPRSPCPWAWNLKLLVDAGCPVDENTLYLAIRDGRTECIKLLIDAGVPVCPEARNWAVDNPEILQLLQI